MSHSRLQQRLVESCGRQQCQSYGRLLANTMNPPAASISRPTRLLLRRPYAHATPSGGPARGNAVEKTAADSARLASIGGKVSSQSTSSEGGRAPTAGAAQPVSLPTSSRTQNLTTLSNNSSPSAKFALATEAAVTSALSSSAGNAALRTAEEREAALRAARLRRLAQKQDREVEEANKAEVKKEYRRRYKAATRKWMSTIIALPIMLVTSYYLFDRLVLGHQPKSLSKFQKESKAKEAGAKEA